MKKYAYCLKIFLINVLFVIFSQGVNAENCGDSSPSVKKGIDPRIPMELVELKAEEINKIIGIFKSLKGGWKGVAHISRCVTKDGKEVEQKQDYSAELSVNSSDKYSIEMDFDLSSSSLKSSKSYVHKIFVEKNYLMFNDGPFKFSANVLYLRDNFITYLRRTKLSGRGNIPVELVRTIAVYSSNSLMIEDVSYTNGVLSEKTLFELE